MIQESRQLLCTAALLFLSMLAGKSGAEPFRDGDTVVFFGDSITHGGMYYKYIADFYRTRYPERKIRFVNSGIGGDSAAGAMKRIPEDVAEYDPTWVVFHFGMNDVDRGAYSDKSASGLLRRRAAAYDNYCRNLDAVVRKVAEAAPRAKFIYLTPTIYDDTAIPTNMPPSATGWATVNQRGCSVALSMMAGHVLEKAARDGALGIDLYTPLQNYLMKRRANEPHFMLTSWDRVHPEGLGHSIMAWTFLRAQGVDPVVSDVAIDAKALSVSRNTNAEVSDVAAIDGGIAFSVLEKALPCPVDAAATPVVGEFGFAESLNREMLSVAGLAPGRYELSVDGCAVGEWAADELAGGVNLSLSDAMPQFAQSRSVFDANERNRETERVLRNHHSARWAYSGRTDVDDVAAFAKWIEKKGENGYFAKFVPGYVEYWPRYREVRAELLAEQEKVYALARPKLRHYRIVRKPR
ncbi:MAG: SGNH/GDSL hydrolase family protein [Kiritimatiellae bacterium]|nr:SGNH/GDSL hydrolase family protein [Kiritimatiellia bacterium]